MKIKRDRYLERLVALKHNGLVKVITGIRRCGTGSCRRWQTKTESCMWGSCLSFWMSRYYWEADRMTPWDDAKLYKTYKLTREEIAFTELMIKPMA